MRKWHSVKACLQQYLHVPVHVFGVGRASEHAHVHTGEIRVRYLPQSLSTLITETPHLKLTNPGSLAGE